jgi:hypothetical protein
MHIKKKIQDKVTFECQLNNYLSFDTMDSAKTKIQD